MHVSNFLLKYFCFKIFQYLNPNDLIDASIHLPQRRDAAMREAVQARRADVQLQGLRGRPHLRALRRVLQEFRAQGPQVCKELEHSWWYRNNVQPALIFPPYRANNDHSGLTLDFVNFNFVCPYVCSILLRQVKIVQRRHGTKWANWRNSHIQLCWRSSLVFKVL